MKIHHLRNATFVIEAGKYHILIDPMLSKKGTLPPFTRKRHKPLANPIVELPQNSSKTLNKVTHCIITHSQKFGIESLTHTDHLDKPGKEFLKNNKLAVVCQSKDASYMKKNKIIIETKLKHWETKKFIGGKITAIPAVHGKTWTRHLMANGSGYFLELPNEPSIYISGDTVYTKDVEKVLTELKPDIAVVASGSASLDVGGHILMPLDEIITFIKQAPNKVIANHLEALNHCPTTRKKLREELTKNNLLSKTLIPEDGETLIFD